MRKKQRLKIPPLEFPSKTLSVETIKTFLTDIFEDRLKDVGWKHYTWEDSKGAYSMWCTNGLCTGDGGKKQFDESLHQLMKNEINNSGVEDPN